MLVLVGVTTALALVLLVNQSSPVMEQGASADAALTQVPSVATDVPSVESGLELPDPHLNASLQAEVHPPSRSIEPSRDTVEVPPRSLRDEEEFRRGAAEKGEQRRRERHAEETRRLLAAGYSQDEIDSLRHRKEELLALQQMEDFRRRENGELASASSFSAAQDGDLLLREEMSDAEYMRYREVLGKPTAFGVTKVAANSIAEQAGIQPGDQVVRYDGTRVFDIYELDGLAMRNTSSGPAMVEILRSGQTIMIALPKGETGLRDRSALGAEILNRAFGR